MKRRILIKIFSDETKGGKDLSLSKGLVKFIFISISLFLISFTFLLYHFINYNVARYKLNQYVTENNYLKKKVKALEQKTALLDSTIDDYYHKYTALATYAGVQPVPYELKNIGIGGQIEEPPTKDLKPVVDLDEKIRKLEKFVDIQMASFQKIENKLERDNYIRSHTPSILPCNGRFTSGFGMRRDPFTGRMHFHYGIDLAAPIGTPIYAPADGIVKRVRRTKGGYGLMLEIDHGIGITTRYGHLSMVLVRPGQKVKRGQIIARVGNTGRSTGPHLHYEVRILNKPVNPLNYIIPYQSFFD